MALRIEGGYKSLNLYFDQPTNAYEIDDVDTEGSLLVRETNIRTDLQGLKIWIRNTSWGSDEPIDSELYYNGAFQSYLSIDKLTAEGTQQLLDNTQYYVKYAFISRLDPNEYTILPIVDGVSSELIGTTQDIALSLSGYLTRDPIEIPTDANGNNPEFTDASGSFIVFRFGQDISKTTAVTYSIKTVDGNILSTGGVTITISNENDATKGTYTVTGITDLTGTIVLTATWTNPENSENTITIEKILNVGKRRPGQTASLVVLTANPGQVFVLSESSNGSVTEPESIKFIATVSNITNPQYVWEVEDNGVVSTIGSDTPGYNLNAPTNDELTINKSVFTGLVPPKFKVIKVIVTSGVIGSNITATDLISAYYIKEGSDAISMGLVGENQTIILNKDGIVVSGLPIEAEAIVLEGTRRLSPPNVQYGISGNNGFVDLTINTADNVPIAGKNAGYIRASNTSATQALVTITATVAGTILSKNLVVTKVQDGLVGQSVLTSYAFIRSNNTPSKPVGGSYSSPNPTGPLNAGGTGITWSDGIPNDNGKPLWASIRIFTSDGLEPEQTEWSIPSKIAAPSQSARFEFSPDGASDWSTVPRSTDQYARLLVSTDNGITWNISGNVVKIKGEKGDSITGAEGLRTIAAYRLRSQTDAPLTSAPGNTIGTAVPSGYDLTAPSATVGQVVWYIFGRYNPNSVTIESIPANTTVWSVPIAASVFQDIKSDNWTGVTPTAATPFPSGAAGYYLKKSSTDAGLYAQNAYIQGTLSSGSSPAISGTAMTGSGAIINSSGTFALGNSTNNITYNGSTITLNGTVVSQNNISNVNQLQNSSITISSGAITGIGTGSGSVILNSLITISSGGTLSNAGGGTVTLTGIGFSGDTDAQRNSRITISSGAITGIGIGSGSVILNSLITISSGGTLSNAGGGTVTLTGIGFSGDTDAQRNSRITISSGAINGIGTGSGSVILNSLITISSGGTLSNAGGGTVTLTGIGFSGDTDAERNSRITISSGAITGIGTGNGSVILNSLITLTGIGFSGDTDAQRNSRITISSGAINGIGTGSGSVILNSLITISSGGTLSNAGGGTVTLTGIGFSGDTDAQRNSRITISSGAITGIGIGSGSVILNSLITISSGGTLSNAGGGTVTYTGLGGGNLGLQNSLTASNIVTFMDANTIATAAYSTTIGSTVSVGINIPAGTVVLFVDWSLGEGAPDPTGKSQGTIGPFISGYTVNGTAVTQRMLLSPPAGYYTITVSRSSYKFNSTMGLYVFYLRR
jgi:hypothetical protein